MAKHNKFNYDLIVLGSGTGGTAGALLAAHAGMRVAIVEADKWGGSSLNYTDIPTSALFHTTHLLAEASTAERFGLSTSNLRYNYPTLDHWKSTAMRRSGAGSKAIYEQAGITPIKGFAHFLSPYEISVGDDRLSASHFLLATGSTLADTGIKGIESTACLTPSTAVHITRPPKTLFIVGAGSTGCEFAQHFAALGTKVLIADIAGRLLPREDEEVGQVLDEVFNKSNIKVLTESRVTLISEDSTSKRVVFLRGGSEKFVRIDEILLATGFRPTTDIGLQNAGVHFTKNGVAVQPTMQTSMKHIYACGDITGGDSSTERSTEQARIAITNLLNKRSKLAFSPAPFPRITNTYPQVATVGATEDDCIRRDRKIKKITLPLSAIPMSNITDFRDGFIKLITDRTGVLIGATIMSPHAQEFISELSLSIHLGLTTTALATCPHPAISWSELIRQASTSLS